MVVSIKRKSKIKNKSKSKVKSKVSNKQINSANNQSVKVYINSKNSGGVSTSKKTGKNTSGISNRDLISLIANASRPSTGASQIVTIPQQPRYDNDMALENRNMINNLYSIIGGGGERLGGAGSGDSRLLDAPTSTVPPPPPPPVPSIMGGDGFTPPPPAPSSPKKTPSTSKVGHLGVSEADLLSGLSKLKKPKNVKPTLIEKTPNDLLREEIESRAGTPTPKKTLSIMDPLPDITKLPPLRPINDINKVVNETMDDMLNEVVNNPLPPKKKLSIMDPIPDNESDNEAGSSSIVNEPIENNEPEPIERNPKKILDDLIITSGITSHEPKQPKDLKKIYYVAISTDKRDKGSYYAKELNNKASNRKNRLFFNDLESANQAIDILNNMRKNL